MDSELFDIEKFFKKIDGKRHLEAIHLAHKEATAAERQLLADKKLNNIDTIDYSSYCEYSETLKDFISYIRYTVKPKIANTTKYQLYRSYLESIPVNSRH